MSINLNNNNNNGWTSSDFNNAWANVTQRVRNAAAAQRSQQKAQQAQQAAPKPSKTYTVTTTKGKQYSFDDDAYNWISSRYFRDNADSYGLDDADQYAKRTGQMSASMRKTYKNSTVDQKLAEMGLPSEKNFEKYLGEYNKWHTGGMDQVYGNAVSSEQWAKMGEMYKRDWAYDNTVEDQTRKALGLVPTKLLAEYADTELDESLMARGLPPSASLSKYNDQYNNYKGIDALYKNAAGAITAMRVTPTDDGKYITNDDQRYTFNGQTMTGKQWYAKAFFDELERTDEKGNQVYASLMPLFKNSSGIVGGDAGIDPTGDYANERGKIITAYAKNAGNAADYDNYNAFSYDDFAGKYGDYYDKYFKNVKDDNGQTVGGFLDVKAREADAEREKAFYTVEDKWFDGDKGIDAFVTRYMTDYPTNTPEQMFTDMLEHGVSEKTVKKAMRALANSAKENKAEDGTSGFYDIKDAYAKAKSNYDAKNKKVDDGHTEELDMLYGPNGYDVVDGKVIPKAAEPSDAKARYEAADKSRKEYVKTALKEAEDDQATIDATANAIQNALSGVTATDVDTVLDVIKSVEKQDFTNPVAVQLALTDLGFTGRLSGFADDLTQGWSQEDKNKLAFYLGGAQLTGQTTEDYFYDFNRAEGDSLGDTWADYGYVEDRRKLKRDDFAYNLEWAQEQIAKGEAAGEVYNVLAGAGFQEELEAYMPEEWRKAIFTDVTVPRMYEQAGGDNLAAWELMSPAERKATADKLWNDMSAEDKAKKYQNADWWKYDPDVYRTTGQAFEQQLTAVLPEFVNNMTTSGVQLVDSLAAGLSGRPEMLDTTQDLMKVQQGLAQFGKVYDETNGAKIADMAGSAAGELLRMYTLGAVGSIAGEAFGATKLGTSLANVAKNGGSKAIRKGAELLMSMSTTSPFILSSYAGNYAEAKELGASNGEAALYGLINGLTEGIVEGLNVDQVWGRAFGSEKLGKQILDGVNAVRGMGPVAKARVMSAAIGFLGEATEEGMGYVVETLSKMKYSDTWGKGTKWSWEDAKEAMLMGGITGALGAGISSGSITAEKLVLDYALSDSAAFNQVFPDLAESIATAESLPKSTLEMYEQGGAVMMSQEAYKFNEGKIEECNDGIESAGKTRDAAKVNAKNELDSALLEIDKVRSKLLGVDVQNADSVHEFMDLCNRLGVKIDLNQPIAQQAATALDARVKSLNDAYNTAIERADTTYENDKRQKEELRAGYEKKRQEHFVGLYLTNRDGIIAEMPDELIKNVAKTYQEGGKYDPDVAAEQRAKSAQPVDVAQGNGYNNTITEEANANGSQGTEAGAGNEGAQAGGNAGVSGQVVTVGNQGGQGSGVLGRENPRWIESVPITEKTRAKGIDPVELRTDNHDASSFYSAIGEAKTANPFGAFVTQHEVDEYSGMRTYLSADDGVGVAVTNDGDIVSVFKNPARNQSKKASTSILFTALENGGKKLDNFNSADLSAIYLQHGFVPVARIKFNDDYAPDGWNYERDGRPDILFWVHNGDDANTILDKMGTYEMPDVDSLPLFEGDDAYDKAAAYRDGLVNESTGWTAQQASNTRSLTDEEVAKVQQAVKDIKYNGDVVFIDDPNEESAWIDDNGTITINRANISETEAKELADNPAWWLLKHEVAHFTEGTMAYDEYAGIVKRIIQNRLGNRYSEAIAAIKNDYAQRGKTLDDMGAERELVAKFMGSGEVLNNANTINAFVREQGNLADRIYNWILYKINDLKLRRQPNSQLARDLLKAERLYAQAYREANRRPAKDNGTTGPDGAVKSQLSTGNTWDEIVKQYGQARAQNETDQQWDEKVQEYGAKPQGQEPRARDIRTPERPNAQKRFSDFLRSLVESDKVGNDQVEAIKRKVLDEDWLSYIPVSQRERMEEARAYIAQRQPLEAQQDFHDMVTSGKLGVKTNALGLQLLSDAAARGDIESVLNIANDLQIAATEAGQSAQIFNVLKELKGVGSAWYMDGLIKKLNTKYADRIQSGKMNPITVPVELMENLSKAVTVDEIAAAENAVAKEIARQLPLTWEARVSNWRYFSMLANPTTHFRNLTGNVLMKGLNAGKDIVATGLEKALNIDESERAHAILTPEDKSTWGGFAEESYKEQARNLSGGGKLSFQTFVDQNMRKFDTKWVNALAEFNFKALEGEDIAFIRPAYKNALMQYMKAQGFTLNEKGEAGKVNKKGEWVAMTNAQKTAAVDWASQQAWKATFRDASSLATMLNKLSKEGPVARLLVEGVMPFKKTPINIAKRGLEYSPAGIIMGTVQLATKVKQGKMSAATAIDNLASGITGTALMALGVALAKAGLIRAGGEKDKKLETYLEDTGDQTYAMKFGDKSINMSSIAPATIPLFMGVALNEMIEQSGETIDLSTITDTIAGTLNPFMEMSFMASLNSALKNYNNNGIGGALGNTLLTAAQNYGSQYLPTLGGKIAQFLDPIRRTTKSDATSAVGGNMDYYARSLAKKIPGLEATLQPDVDVWGRTDVKDSFSDWAWDFANKFILPTNVKVTNRDAVDNELIRVVESTGVTDFLPSDGNKYFTVKGERYNMNARQYAQYSQERGQAAYVALKELMASPSYQAASDETKADMLNKAKEAAYKQVNAMWKEKLGAFDK